MCVEILDQIFIISFREKFVILRTLLLRVFHAMAFDKSL
jgi:uncharacterized membrane protein